MACLAHILDALLCLYCPVESGKHVGLAGWRLGVFQLATMAGQVLGKLFLDKGDHVFADGAPEVPQGGGVFGAH